MNFPFGPANTGDGYTAAATFSRFAPCQRLNVNVQANPVYMQRQLGLSGSWGPEELIRPGAYNFADGLAFTGVRFRSAGAGLPATVSITAKII